MAALDSVRGSGTNPGDALNCHDPLKSIVILGGGTAGWMTAAALAQVFKRRLKITLIESEEIGVIGVGEATIPTLHWFNDLIGLERAAFMRETNATFKLGVGFTNWTKPNHYYFHPFGTFGKQLQGTPFHHLWRKVRPNEGYADLERYSLSAQAAFANRFALPATDPQSIRSTMGYAYQFDASLYARLLRTRAEAHGTTRLEGKVKSVLRDGETGFVQALVTEDGRRLEADFFIDCSGFRSLLIGETLKIGFEDWSHWLPCNRAWAAPSANTGPLEPYTSVTSRPAGWQWKISLQHRTGNGHVYCQSFMDDERARDIFLENIAGEVLAEPRLIRFTAGKRRLCWEKNVLAVGLSGGFLEPLESTSIHSIQSAIAKFLGLMPDKYCDPHLATRFNKMINYEMELIRDFLTLHYHATYEKTDPLWEYCRHMKLPDSLIDREEIFLRSGRVICESHDLFQETNWLAVMMGQGLNPEGYHPLADALDPEIIEQFLARVRKLVVDATAHFPEHSQALKSL